jgi:hypothetical protein
MWNKVVWHCQNPSARAIAFISFLVMDSQAPTESAPSRSKVLLEEIRVALERTRSSFVSSGLLAVLVVLSGSYLQEASAAEQAKPDHAIEKRIQELIPSLEGYIIVRFEVVQKLNVFVSHFQNQDSLSYDRKGNVDHRLASHEDGRIRPNMEPAFGLSKRLNFPYNARASLS